MGKRKLSSGDLGDIIRKILTADNNIARFYEVTSDNGKYSVSGAASSDLKRRYGPLYDIEQGRRRFRVTVHNRFIYDKMKSLAPLIEQNIPGCYISVSQPRTADNEQ